MTEIHFEIGDIVRLRTGDRAMTLDRFDDNTGECICSWREVDELRTGNFPPAALEAVMATKA